MSEFNERRKIYFTDFNTVIGYSTQDYRIDEFLDEIKKLVLNASYLTILDKKVFVEYNEEIEKYTFSTDLYNYEIELPDDSMNKYLSGKAEEINNTLKELVRLSKEKHIFDRVNETKRFESVASAVAYKDYLMNQNKILERSRFNEKEVTANKEKIELAYNYIVDHSNDSELLSELYNEKLEVAKEKNKGKLLPYLKASLIVGLPISGMFFCTNDIILMYSLGMIGAMNIGIAICEGVNISNLKEYFANRKEINSIKRKIRVLDKGNKEEYSKNLNNDGVINYTEESIEQENQFDNKIINALSITVSKCDDLSREDKAYCLLKAREILDEYVERHRAIQSNMNSSINLTNESEYNLVTEIIRKIALLEDEIERKKDLFNEEVSLDNEYNELNGIINSSMQNESEAKLLLKK